MNKKMRWLRWSVVLAVLVLLAGTVWASALVDHKAVLSGRVSSQCLAVVGQEAREGDVLMRVDTIAGAQPAVRASVDGVVREVLVRAGDTVQAGQVVVRLEAGK